MICCVWPVAFIYVLRFEGIFTQLFALLTLLGLTFHDLLFANKAPMLVLCKVS